MPGNVNEPPFDSQGVGSGPPATPPSGQSHRHDKASETGHQIVPPFDSKDEWIVASPFYTRCTDPECPMLKAADPPQRHYHYVGEKHE